MTQAKTARNNRIYKMNKNGMSTREIAGKVGLSQPVVWKIINRCKIKEAHEILDNTYNNGIVQF